MNLQPDPEYISSSEDEVRDKAKLLELYQAKYRDKCRKTHLGFMEYTWMKSGEPFIKGFHTDIICNRIDQAFKDFRNGKSTYLKIGIHHRSGKSDLLSRYLPPHFLGEFPDCEVISTTYQAALTQKFTAFARNIFRSEKYGELYPNLALSQESNAKAYWEIVDSKTGKPTQGKLFGSGISSGITGSGGHLVLLDDPISGRKDAESKVIRDGVWDAFTNDLMTRLAPVHIVIILATQWHWDDPQGRIDSEMQRNPDFPRFETLRFPAKATDYHGEGSYPNKYLFMERYSESWYKSQYATLGRYGAAALLDCDPQQRSGGLLSTDGIIWHDKDDKTIPSDTAIQWAQVWDLAHTAKQRGGDDPDYTSGTLLGFQTVPNDPIPHLWIKHVARFREGAKRRDALIKMYSKKAGRFVKHAIENSIESKDAYEYIKSAIPDYSWQLVNLKGDKTVRATPLEPIFEAPGHVHVLRGEWNDDWLDEIIKFDGLGNTHDDQVDNLSAGYALLVGQKTVVSNELHNAMRAYHQNR